MFVERVSLAAQRVICDESVFYLASNRPEGLGVTVYACAKIPTKSGNPNTTVILYTYTNRTLISGYRCT